MPVDPGVVKGPDDSIHWGECFVPAPADVAPAEQAGPRLLSRAETSRCERRLGGANIPAPGNNLGPTSTVECACRSVPTGAAAARYGPRLSLAHPRPAVTPSARFNNFGQI